jgi:hypothetical protein
MALTGRFNGPDGTGGKVVIIDDRGPWYGFPSREIDVASIAIGAQVEFEVQEVPNKDPSKKPYKRFTRITPVGQAAPPSLRPVAAPAAAVTRTYAAAPAAAAPQSGVQYPSDNRAEDIFIAGIVNRYVQATGDISVIGIAQAAFNARDAFRMVQSNQRPVQQPARAADNSVAPFNDETPF